MSSPISNLEQRYIVITFYSPSCLGEETAKGPFSLRVSCHLPICIPHTEEASHSPFDCWTSSRKAVNTKFYCLWFDPPWNRTRVYRFSSRRPIHSTTDRLYPWEELNLCLCNFDDVYLRSVKAESGDTQLKKQWLKLPCCAMQWNSPASS